jgi:hypothetical protein
MQNTEAIAYSTLYSGPLGTLTIPENYRAGRSLGEGASWCILGSDSQRFYDYHYQIYIWRGVKSEDLFAFHFNQKTGRGEVADKYNRYAHPKQIDYFRKEHPVLKDVFQQAESKFITSPQTAYHYALTVLRTRWREAEPMIFSDNKVSKQYITYVIKNKFHRYRDGHVLGQQPLDDIVIG